MAASNQADLPALDELRLLVVLDNEIDSLSSVDDGVPQLPEFGRTVPRVPTTRTWEGHECKTAFELCGACHGFSVLVTGRRGDEEHTMLFDVGPFHHVWLDNARRLGVDLACIEALFLSHWHADHSGGIPGVVAAIAEARRAAGIRTPLPADLHPDRPDQRGFLLPSGTMLMLPDEPTFGAIEAAGGRVALHAETHTLCDGFFLASGEIARVTEYETGIASHHTRRGEAMRPDPLIMDERFLAAFVSGRGISLLTACSHAGVVNASLGALKTCAPEPLDIVLGGFHLSGKAMEGRIEATVRDLKARAKPRIVAPGHCSGWRAKVALAQAFAPGHYGPSFVGSTYTLRAH
jgi:7,8-dihydropterin-6-yl-methyl-4-(beta-D-ribofuranosyl)aminobenzene 5'-phosphate synthase